MASRRWVTKPTAWERVSTFLVDLFRVADRDADIRGGEYLVEQALALRCRELLGIRDPVGDASVIEHHGGRQAQDG